VTEPLVVPPVTVNGIEDRAGALALPPALITRGSCGAKVKLKVTTGDESKVRPSALSWTA